MAKRILVPLDGTLEAESIVPIVVDTARGAGATVRLLYVSPSGEAVIGPDGRVVVFADQETARLAGEGRDYLAAVEVAFDDVPVEKVIRFGAPIEAILDEADDFGADLIAITNGSGRPFCCMAPGRVAEQLIRHADVAVVIVHSRGRVDLRP